MGLASALTTALTGMTAAETQIDVVGNNLANSQTVGFKASTSVFATQFLQTQSLGSGPTATAAAAPTRGKRAWACAWPKSRPTSRKARSKSARTPRTWRSRAMASSSSKARKASGCTRATASSRPTPTTSWSPSPASACWATASIELTRSRRTTLVPLTIPLGTAAVGPGHAERVPARHAHAVGRRRRHGRRDSKAPCWATAAFPGPTSRPPPIGVAPTPDATGVTVGTRRRRAARMPEGAPIAIGCTFVDASGNETLASNEVVVTVPAGDALANNTDHAQRPARRRRRLYRRINIYRTAAGRHQLLPARHGRGRRQLYRRRHRRRSRPRRSTTTSLNGNYSYVSPTYRSGEAESRPSLLLGPQNVVNGRIHLDESADAAGARPRRRLPGLRHDPHLSQPGQRFELVLPRGRSRSRARLHRQPHRRRHLRTSATPGNQALDLDGPKVDSNTLLVERASSATASTTSNLFQRRHAGVHRPQGRPHAGDQGVRQSPPPRPCRI